MLAIYHTEMGLAVYLPFLFSFFTPLVPHKFNSIFVELKWRSCTITSLASVISTDDRLSDDSESNKSYLPAFNPSILKSHSITGMRVLIACQDNDAPMATGRARAESESPAQRDPTSTPLRNKTFKSVTSRKESTCFYHVCGSQRFEMRRFFANQACIGVIALEASRAAVISAAAIRGKEAICYGHHRGRSGRIKEHRWLEVLSAALSHD